MRSITEYIPGLKGASPVSFDGIKIADLGDTLDANGNEILEYDAVASAINNLGIANAAVSGTPNLYATGDDTNIGISITPKGTGGLFIPAPVNFKRQVTDTGGAYATPVVLTSAQSGRVILVDDAAGLDFTLPAIGSGDIGMHFKFVVTVTITSNNFRVTAAAGDLLFGGLWMPDFDAAVDSLTREGIWLTPDGTDDLIMTMNGSTTGGKKGTCVEFIATSATQWFVSGLAAGDGAIATPFS